MDVGASLTMTTGDSELMAEIFFSSAKERVMLFMLGLGLGFGRDTDEDNGVEEDNDLLTLLGLGPPADSCLGVISTGGGIAFLTVGVLLLACGGSSSISSLGIAATLVRNSFSRVCAMSTTSSKGLL
uniref:Uncharacterized protein n=1 Tax=Cacopsylla melanoneura TaxID=428564 RepID=A0A8D8XNY4_9HEMI